MTILFDKHPIVLDKNMATIIGVNEAIILQQVHYWLEINKKVGKNFHEGRYWTYNTYDEWHEQFPFWSKETIKRAFKRLRGMKIIIVDRFNVYHMDRTLWYTIDYNRLNSIMNVSNNSNRNNQIPSLDDTQTDSKNSNHNAPMDKVKSTPPIPEINTEISTETISQSVKGTSDQTDGQIDKPSPKKLDARDIVARCELENIPQHYREPVFKAILLLVHDINTYENIKVGDIYIPKDIAKAVMERLDFFVIEHAIEKFKEASKTTKIKNPINYFKSCIFNAISEIDIDIDAEVRYDMERDMYKYHKHFDSI